MHIEEIKRAAAEILEAAFQGKQTAAQITANYLRARRYVGSHDRRTLSEMVWKAIRYHAHLMVQTTDFAKQLTLLDTCDINTDKTPDWVRWECPEWLIPHVPDAANELPAMVSAAPTILRAIGDREAIRKRLIAQGINAVPTELSPFGLKLDKRANLNLLDVYQEGLVEVQDEGSQLVSLKTGVQAGQNVLDMCAGAGGKSLAFAQIMNNTGHIVAYDPSHISLQELNRRAKRANVTNITTVQHLPEDETFDVVVVDAPCSGSGTWRRAPDAKWRLKPEFLDKLIKTQATILDKSVALTKKRLCYITCSLFFDENEAQIDAFIARHSEFKCLLTQRLSPYRTHTDGFFIAVMERA